MANQELARLSDDEIMQLDPYAFMAVIGKKVIHPGGRRSTEELFRLADLQAHHQVLDIGAGVGTTAIEIAARFGCRVTAIDIDPIMTARGRANVQAAGLDHRVTVTEGDIQSLAFPDNSFDRIVIEAVMMFVDQPAAAREVARVCRPRGRVLDHEFIYRQNPPPAVRSCFDQVCPGTRFESVESWSDLYHGAGFTDIRHVSGSFTMMTPGGMLRDEGLGNLLRMTGRMLGRAACLKKMKRLMARMLRVRTHLGQVVLVGTKPDGKSGFDG